MSGDRVSKLRRLERLDERFEFQSDAVALTEHPVLQSMLFNVIEKRTGAERALRVWRKTGTSADRDLRDLWEHERRQIQRLMATAGAPELIVRVLDFVEDDNEFGAILEYAGQALSHLRQRVDQSHWVRNLVVSRNRIVLWRNLARMSQAIGLLHAQGIIHGRLGASVVMTEGGRVPDFKLTGFEWSLWLAAPSPSAGRSNMPKRGHEGVPYSFATDWQAFGRMTSDLLGLVINEDGGVHPSQQGPEPTPGEIALVRRLVSPSRSELLEASNVARSIEDIIAELELQGAVRLGTFLLLLPDTCGIGLAAATATGGGIVADDQEGAIAWAQADLAGGITFLAPAEEGGSTPLYLLTDTMRYEVRPSQSRDEEPTWQIAYCRAAHLRTDAPSLRGRYERHPVTQPVQVYGVPRRARDALARLGPAALDWEIFLKSSLAEGGDAREDVQHALVLVQVIEAAFRGFDALPVELLEMRRDNGVPTVVVRAKPDNDRDADARALGLPLTAEALQRILVEEQRAGDEGWTLSTMPSLGATQQGDSHAEFVREIIHRGLVAYEFRLEQELDRQDRLILRPRQESGTQQVVLRRLKAIKALGEQPGLADFLLDPWVARRSAESDLVEDDELAALDAAKRAALERFSSTSPAHFVVGPPGVGKTTLATEVVRRRLASGGSSRLLLTAQGHDALDNLQAAVERVARASLPAMPIIVRAPSERRARGPGDPRSHVAQILGDLATSPAVSRLPPPVRARVEALASASRAAAIGGGTADKARAGLRSMDDLITESADIVIATTNSALIERLLEEKANFDTVIVEEAAKATGPELVGALLLSGRRLLIGDHNQLPPFDSKVLERVLRDHSLATLVLDVADRVAGALFPTGELDALRKAGVTAVRMERIRGLAYRLVQFFKTVAEGDETRLAANPHHRQLASLLDEQRRMHPALAEVVSKVFYGGRLRTAPDREAAAYSVAPPFSCAEPLPLSPLVIVDFPHVQATGREQPMERDRRRWHNPAEAEAVLATLQLISPLSTAPQPTLAVLSPYLAQVGKLDDKIAAARQQGLLPALDGFLPARPGLGFVNTVDSFQGAEADIVVVSLVRNNPRTGFSALGFLRDPQRMNVLLSRAKTKLVLVTSLQFLDLATADTGKEQEPELAFLRSLLDAIQDMSRRTGPDEVPFAAIVQAEKLRGLQ
jgi:hypothetical protein